MSKAGREEGEIESLLDMARRNYKMLRRDVAFVLSILFHSIPFPERTPFARVLIWSADMYLHNRCMVPQRTIVAFTSMLFDRHSLRSRRVVSSRSCYIMYVADDRTTTRPGREGDVFGKWRRRRRRKCHAILGR